MVTEEGRFRKRRESSTQRTPKSSFHKEATPDVDEIILHSGEQLVMALVDLNV